MSPSPDVLVAGAGVMGLWTALRLSERGLTVAVAEPWEPGHPRATSSSESRVIRCLYGGDALYAAWARRAIAEWQRAEVEWGTGVVTKCGVLWLAREEDGYEAAGERELRRQGIPIERLSPADVPRRFPAIAAEGLSFALFEPEAGAILAREAVRLLAADLGRRGVRFLRGAAVPGGANGGRLRDVVCGTERVAAGAFVFACGPWLTQVFPDLLRGLLRVHRAEELYFAVPDGTTAFDAGTLPAWVEIGGYYGIPSLAGRGFKVGIDRPGPEIDPTTDDRVLDPALVPPVREYLARRFPGLATAPLVDSRVCTYELTPDEHLVIDRHPALDNVWLAGGGSGHAFKLGPAIGDSVAALVAGEVEGSEERFRLRERSSRDWRQA
jgi:glycine/D-amino acid oxidase-like deaminating enzyme